MLNVKAIKRLILVKEADIYSNRAAYSYKLFKAAEESASILSQLNDLEDSIVDNNFHNKIALLLFNYKNFLEETGAHKLNKDLEKIGFFSDKIQESLQQIVNDPYTKTFDHESDDFDGEEFNELMKKVYDDLVKTVNNLGDVPDYDEVEQIENLIKDIIERSLREDSKFSSLFRAGKTEEAMDYLESEIPELEKYRVQLENYREITKDLGQVGETGYTSPGVYVINREKRLQRAREAAKYRREQIKKLIKINPNHPTVVKHFEQRKQHWLSIKSDPEKHSEYKKQRKDKRKNWIEELELKSKTDPKALEQLESFRKSETEKTMGYWQRGEKSVERFDIHGEPIKVTKQLDIQMLRNKFVIVKARDFSKKLAAKAMKNHPEWGQLKGKEREDKIKEYASEMKKSEEYIQFINNLPLELDKDPEILKLKSDRPDAYAEIMKSIERLKSKA